MYVLNVNNRKTRMLYINYIIVIKITLHLNINKVILKQPACLNCQQNMCRSNKDIVTMCLETTPS